LRSTEFSRTGNTSRITYVAIRTDRSANVIKSCLKTVLAERTDFGCASNGCDSSTVDDDWIVESMTEGSKCGNEDVVVSKVANVFCDVGMETSVTI